MPCNTGVTPDRSPGGLSKFCSPKIIFFVTIFLAITLAFPVDLREKTCSFCKFYIVPMKVLEVLLDKSIQLVQVALNLLNGTKHRLEMLLQTAIAKCTLCTKSVSTPQANIKQSFLRLSKSLEEPKGYGDVPKPEESAPGESSTGSEKPVSAAKLAFQEKIVQEQLQPEPIAELAFEPKPKMEREPEDPELEPELEGLEPKVEPIQESGPEQQELEKKVSLQKPSVSIKSIHGSFKGETFPPLEPLKVPEIRQSTSRAPLKQESKSRPSFKTKSEPDTSLKKASVPRESIQRDLESRASVKRELKSRASIKREQELDASFKPKSDKCVSSKRKSGSDVSFKRESRPHAFVKSDLKSRVSVIKKSKSRASIGKEPKSRDSYKKSEELPEDIDKEKIFESIQKLSIFSRPVGVEDESTCSRYTERRCAKCQCRKRKEARSRRMSAEERYKSYMSKPNIEKSSIAVTAQPSSTSRGTVPDEQRSFLDERTSSNAKQTISSIRRPSAASIDRDHESIISKHSKTPTLDIGEQEHSKPKATLSRLSDSSIYTNIDKENEKSVTNIDDISKAKISDSRRESTAEVYERSASRITITSALNSKSASMMRTDTANTSAKSDTSQKNTLKDSTYTDIKRKPSTSKYSSSRGKSAGSLPENAIRPKTDRSLSRHSAEQRAHSLCCKGGHSDSCCNQIQQVGKSFVSKSEQTSIRKSIAEIEKRAARDMKTAHYKRGSESATVKSGNVARGTQNEFIHRQEIAPQSKGHRTQQREPCTCQSKRLCSDECKRGFRGGE